MYGRREGRGGYRDGGGDGGGWRGEGGGGWGGGRGRGRGGGGRGRGGGGGGRGRGERPPPHLKGREIGLWYAQRSKDRQEKDVNLLPTLSMDASQVRNVGRMLDSLDEKDYSSRDAKRPEYRAGASYQPEPDDDLSDEWDKRISSIVKKEFKDDDSTDVAGSSSGGADSFSNPDAWIQDNTQKRKISAGVFQT
ncbi:uncharacterized protein LOC134765521 [Penaeus indicus]|uniref:uncharacterized protein LOC134765521 n=1 Tax=Penaeus indicus TaxID=29960 RepID=UPI00300DB1D0